MRKGLGIWIFVIISALILYLFSNETVTLALLLALIAMLPASFLLLRFSRRNLEVSLNDSERTDNKSSFTLTLKNKGWLPIASAEAEVRCENLRTGETDLYRVHRGLMPHKSKEVQIEVSPTHAGRYDLSVSVGRIYDPLDGELIAEIRSPVSGTVYFVYNSPLINSKTVCFKIIK